MKKLTLSFATIFIIISCINRESKEDKKDLLGNDYKLFQKTPLSQLANALDNEDTIKMKEILKKEKLNINFKEPKFGSTLLMLSIKNSQYQSVKLLLESGADPNIADNYRGETPVICAANNNDPKYLELLLNNKGNPNAIENAPFKENDEVRQTALLASINPLDPNSLQKVKLLVNAGANVNYYDKGHTDLPLSEAITSKKMDVVLFLLKNGANHNLVMFEMVDGHEVYILEALRKCVFDLNSDEYIAKRKVISLLKEKGLDYDSEPIPDYILKEIKEKYPKNWEHFASKY